MGGMIPWKLHVTGKLFHSGLAHKGDSLLIILKSFIEKQSAQSTRKLSLCCKHLNLLFVLLCVLLQDTEEEDTLKVNINFHFIS
uniref:Peptidase M20 dimerisation domain-containing protein n=1 Tax=Lactuca sativa TaxID=4236 RepID=A0A9R1V2K1_LACSA|nr:hypothetical protein LSAT_V11C700382280 [Lactuca sativa]